MRPARRILGQSRLPRRGGLVVLLAATPMLVSCGGLADDAARALNTTKDDVVRIADEVAGKTGASTDDVLEEIATRGDEIVSIASRNESAALPLLQASDESAARIDDLVTETICDVADHALEHGDLPTPADVAESFSINALVGMVPQAEVYEAASKFVDAIEDLQAGNYSVPSGGLHYYYYRYCGFL